MILKQNNRLEKFHSIFIFKNIKAGNQMMNMGLAVVMGALGLVAGFFAPLLARKTIIYKYAKKNKEFVEDKRFTGSLLKVGSALFNAAGWAVIGFFAKNPFSAVLLSLLWTMAIIIAVIDVRVHMIPNETVLAVAALGIFFQLSYFGVTGLLYSAISIIAVMVAFTVLAGIMGFGVSVGAGDVKLAGAMGLVLGYPYILHGLLAMSALMIVYCIIGLLTKRLTLKSMFPFAPFMMAGMTVAIIAILLG